jgi:predicted NBD/HSP70 family sugar kinase
MAVVVPAAHGTLVSVVSADGEVLSLSDQVRKGVGPTPAAEVLDTVDAALGRSGATADDIGLAVLGLPGASEFNDGGQLPPSPSRHLRRFRDWNGQSPAAILSQHLGCPTFTENDANLAALGEAHVGAGTGMGTVLFVGMVHGTGSGLVLDGRLHRGRAGLAGEIGHLHTSDDGRLCECGARGCFWQTRSIPALLDELSTLERRTFTIEDLSETAARGEPDVVRALQGLGEALGRRLADAVVFLDPDIVIVDSALADAAEAVTDGIRSAVHRCAPAEMVRGLKITTGELGCAAHVHGALALARTHGLWGAAASTR